LKTGDQTSMIVRIILLIAFFSLGIANAQVINRGEYFVDADPGNGNGTAFVITTPAFSINQNIPIPTSALAAGFHILGVRTKRNTGGAWSHPSFSAFYIVPPITVTNATTLSGAEYFFDADPGNGNGTAIALTPAATLSLALAIPTSSLTPGFHTLHVRTRDNLTRWALVAVQSFYIVPPLLAPGSVNLTRAEYFFDADPGQGNGVNLPISTSVAQTNSFAIPVTGLAEGFHTLNIRYRSNANPRMWSHAFMQSFFITKITTTNLQRLEYFVDTDPGFGSGVALPFTPAATVDQSFAINLTGVPTGNHTLNIRAKDSRGFWSYIETGLFAISACTPPTAPAAPPVNRCNAGPLTLAANGASGAQVYRWYDDPILNTILFTGASFTTPVLTTSKNYYVSVFDTATSCESSRTLVTAAINLILKPTINPSGTISFCEGSFVFLSAPTGFSQYTWSNGQTTQQILVNTAGNYTVKTGDGTCLSEVSDAATVNIIPAPTKPSITVTGNTTICGSGSVGLTGPAGFEYIWSTGATTQTITINQTAVLFLIVKSMGASCPSLPSDPIVVTVLTPPCTGGGGNNAPPIINTTPLAAQIEGQVNIDLTKLVSDADNNINFSSLRIINNQTSRGVTAFIDGSFFLQIDYSGNPFTGVDRITLEVCDLVGACSQQVIDINVVGDVLIFNGMTPDGDGFNDFLLLKYVDVVEGASKNKVTIYNRWGDVVFDVDDYDNLSRVFAGQTNGGKDLPSGTYFYKIDFANNSKTGFITLKR
jgi:gliding motility-associated-like protein